MTRILIFYSKTGAGHLRSAEAVADHLKKIDQSLNIQLVDGLAINNFGKSTYPERIFHHFSTRLLFLYNFLYVVLNNFIGVFILRSVVKLFWGQALKKVVDQFKPDLIITTHPAISPAVLSHIGAPFVVVCVDLGQPHRLWFDQKADYIIVADHLVKNHAEKFATPEKIVVLGYPLREDFKTPASPHLPSGRILILGGGAGVGNIKKQTLSLTRAFPDKKFVAVCGFNQSLEKQLKEKNLPNLKVLGFVHHIPQLIAEADIVLTKAGPATLIEAAIMKTPIIITSWVVMQEKDNVDFIVNNKLGLYCPDINRLPEAISTIYQNYSKYSHGEMELAGGSEQIAKFLLQNLILLPKIHQQREAEK